MPIVRVNDKGKKRSISKVVGIGTLVFGLAGIGLFLSNEEFVSTGIVISLLSCLAASTWGLVDR